MSKWFILISHWVECCSLAQTRGHESSFLHEQERAAASQDWVILDQAPLKTHGWACPPQPFSFATLQDVTAAAASPGYDTQRTQGQYRHRHNLARPLWSGLPSQMSLWVACVPRSTPVLWFKTVSFHCPSTSVFFPRNALPPVWSPPQTSRSAHCHLDPSSSLPSSPPRKRAEKIRIISPRVFLLALGP